MYSNKVSKSIIFVPKTAGKELLSQAENVLLHRAITVFA